MGSDSRARCSDGGERVKLYVGKNQGRLFPLESFFVLLFPLQFLPALYDLNACNRLTNK